MFFSKSFKVVLIVMLLFVSIVFVPAKKVNAVPFVIPAIPGIVKGGIAVGTMVAGGVVATYEALKYGEELEETVDDIQKIANEAGKFAFEAYKGASSAIHEAFDTAYESAVNAGNTMVVLPEILTNWITDTLSPSLTQNVGVTTMYTDSVVMPYKKGGTYVWEWYVPYDWSQWKEILLIDGVAYGSMQGRGDVKRLYTIDGLEGPEVTYIGLSSSEIEITLVDSSLSFENDVPSVPVDLYADQVGEGVERVFQKSKEQGVKMPNELLGGLALGTGILFNPADNLWYNEDGSVYEGDFSEVDWNFPDLSIETDAAGNIVTGENDFPIVLAPGYSIPGVTDVPASNVITGEPVEVNTPGEPGVTNPPKTSSINWKKLLQVGELFTTVFPFSIPWDVGRAFEAVFGSFDENVKPSWDFPLNFLGKTYEFNISIPDFFYNLMPTIRAMMLIFFDISLIYAIRKWLGGAS